MTDTATTLTRNPDGSRYEARLDGEIVAFADYRETPDGIEFPHTVVVCAGPAPAARNQTPPRRHSLVAGRRP